MKGVTDESFRFVEKVPPGVVQMAPGRDAAEMEKGFTF